MNAIARTLRAEPVLMGALILAVCNAALEDAGELWKAVPLAAVAWLVRLLSTPTQKATEQAEKAATSAAAQATVQSHHDLGLLVLEAAPRPPAKAQGASRKRRQ